MRGVLGDLSLRNWTHTKSLTLSH